MMLRRLLRSMLLVLVVAAPAGIGPVSAGELKHDPFARPMLLPQASASLPSGAKAGPVAEDTGPWPARLMAVMVAGENSLVNVDGTILRLGEQIDGHRLVQVRDGEAVFTKGRKRFVLRIDVAGAPEIKQRDRP